MPKMCRYAFARVDKRRQVVGEPINVFQGLAKRQIAVILPLPFNYGILLPDPFQGQGVIDDYPDVISA